MNKTAEETFDEFIRIVGANTNFTINKTFGFDFVGNHCDVIVLPNDKYRTIFLVKVNNDISACGIGFLMSEPYLQKITKVKFLKGEEKLFFEYYLLAKLCN